MKSRSLVCVVLSLLLPSTYAAEVMWQNTRMFNTDSIYSVIYEDWDVIEGSTDFPAAVAALDVGNNNPPSDFVRTEASYAVTPASAQAKISAQINWSSALFDLNNPLMRGSGDNNFFGDFTVTSSTGAATVDAVVNIAASHPEHQIVVLIQEEPMDWSSPAPPGYDNWWVWSIEHSMEAGDTPMTFNAGQIYYAYVWAHIMFELGAHCVDQPWAADYCLDIATAPLSGDETRSNHVDMTFTFSEDPPLDSRYDFDATGSYKSGGAQFIDDIAVDAAGNRYIAGVVYGAHDFDPGPGQDVQGVGGGVYVSRINADHSYAWTRFFPVPNPGEFTDPNLRVSNDLVYLTGPYYGVVDFDPSEGVDLHDGGPGPSKETFVTQLTTDGSYGWTYTDTGRYFGGIETDDFGNVVIAGRSDLVAVTRVAPDGTVAWEMSWDHYYSRSAPVYFTDIEVGSDGNYYLWGRLDGYSDFDPGPGLSWFGSYQKTYWVMLKLVPDALGGLTFGWVLNFELGSSHVEMAYGGDAIYITRWAAPGRDYDPTSGVDVRNESDQIVVTKILSDGSYGWTWMNEHARSRPQAIVVDDYGNIFVGGKRDGNGQAWQATQSYLKSDGQVVWDYLIGPVSYRHIDVRSVVMDGARNVHFAGALGNYYFSSGYQDMDPTDGTSIFIWNDRSLYVTKWKHSFVTP